MAGNADIVAAARLLDAVTQLGGNGRTALGVYTRHPRTCIDDQR